MELERIFASYPDVQAVFVTSDGARHFSEEEAEAQASHLEDRAIQTFKRPKGKGTNGDAHANDPASANG